MLAALSLAAMVGVFFGLAGTAGTVAVGWAWFASQVVYALTADWTASWAGGATRFFRNRGSALRLGTVCAVLIGILASMGVFSVLGWVAAGLLVGGTVVAVLPEFRILRMNPTAGVT